jgi:hypothetical protein
MPSFSAKAHTKISTKRKTREGPGKHFRHREIKKVESLQQSNILQLTKALGLGSIRRPPARTTIAIAPFMLFLSQI